MHTAHGFGKTAPKHLTMVCYADPADPLRADEAEDVFRPLSHRQLCRLLLVATEVGARFQRDGIVHDPLAWMYAPRKMFRGLAAVDAAIELENCERAVLMHALGLGTDVDPDLIDALRTEEDCEAQMELIQVIVESAAA